MPENVLLVFEVGLVGLGQKPGSNIEVVDSNTELALKNRVSGSLLLEF